MIADLILFKAIHVFREANGLADKIVSIYLDQAFNEIDIGTLSEEIQAIVNNDKGG